MVFAQKSIQIGTIGIAQVAQPALAVVWSFLLLGEIVNERQAAGIAIVVGGLLAFVVLNQRGERRAQAICLTARASIRSRSVMKCDADCHPPSARAQSSRAAARSPALGRDPGERVEGEDLDRGVVVAPRGGEDRGEPLLRARHVDPRRRAPRAGTRRAPPARRRRRRGATPPPPRAPRAPPPSRPSARRTRPRWTRAERRQAHVAGRLGLLDRELQRRRAGRVVAGLALRPPEAGELVGLGLAEAEPSRRLRRATDVARRRRRSGARCGPARRASRRGARAATGRRPPAASARPRRAPRRRATGRRRRSRPARRRARSRPGPRAGPGPS